MASTSVPGLESVPEAICIIDARTGTINLANARFGRSVVQITQENKGTLPFIDNFVGVEDRPRFKIAVERTIECAKAGSAFTGEDASDMDDWLSTPVVRDCDTLAVGSSKDFPVWRRYDWMLSLWPEGGILLSGRMTTVVSEEKKTNEKDLQDFLNKAPIAMHWLSGTGHVLWANETEMNVLGYTAEEYIGQPIMKFCPDEEELVLEIFKTLGSGNAIKDVPVRFRTKGGDIKDLLIDSNVNWNADGSFKHTRCFIRDDTERKVREARLQEAAKLAANVAEAKDAFVRKTFHEIRTPCHILDNLLVAWKECTDEKEQLVTFRDVNNQVNRLNRLVDDIVDASLFDSGQVPTIANEAFNIIDLINNITDRLVAAGRGAPNVEKVVVYAGQEPCPFKLGLNADNRNDLWFKGDAKKLGRVLEHLLENALKFTTEGRVQLEFNVSYGEDDEYPLILLTVQDTGPGFREESVQMAFSRYWQDVPLPGDGASTAENDQPATPNDVSLSPFTSPAASMDQSGADQANPRVARGSTRASSLMNVVEFEGLGVGLNVVNNLIQCMGGTLDFSTSAGDTAFCVSLALEPCRPPMSNPATSWKGSSMDSASGSVGDGGGNPRSSFVAGATGVSQWYSVDQSPAASAHVTPDDYEREKGLPPVGLRAMTATKPHLLVVDDNVICQKVLAALVKKLGCTCDVACNGQEAVNMVDDNRHMYDLVFMDIRMPVMDGMEATRHIRHDLHIKDLPVVAFTAEVGDSIRAECMKDHLFDDFVSKPAGKAEVWGVIDKLVLQRFAKSIQCS